MPSDCACGHSDCSHAANAASASATRAHNNTPSRAMTALHRGTRRLCIIRCPYRCARTEQKRSTTSRTSATSAQWQPRSGSKKRSGSSPHGDDEQPGEAQKHFSVKPRLVGADDFLRIGGKKFLAGAVVERRQERLQ